jgi:hypothetical protein
MPYAGGSAAPQPVSGLPTERFVIIGVAVALLVAAILLAQSLFSDLGLNSLL